MARGVGRLNAMSGKRDLAPGLHHDGHGLYLQVSGKRARSWVLRYTLRGTARVMGLGPATYITLAEARQRTHEAHRLLLDGIDPIEHRNAERAAVGLAAARVTTFAECFESWMAAHGAGWTKKHESTLRGQITKHALPLLGKLPVAEVDTPLVLKVLGPIWTTKTVTARRVRDTIEAILDFAKSSGRRTGENPARWKGHLRNLLAKPAQVHTVQNLEALPYAEVGEFMVKLRTCNGRDADALELAVLTAARAGEIVGAPWGEFDLDARIWTIPASRMKGGREHKVPLSGAAMAVLGRIGHRAGLVFPQASDVSLARVRRRIGYGHITTHGLRSTFRDWCGDCTGFPRELAEQALAHKVGNETEAAYRRGTALEKRRRLMEAWAEFCGKPALAGEVVPLRKEA